MDASSAKETKGSVDLVSLTHHGPARIKSSEDPRVLGDVDRSTDGE